MFFGLVLLLGLTIGSFLNVIIYRLPRGESIALPPSHCFFCEHSLNALDLIPVMSFLFLGGHCRYCGSMIKPRYCLVELLTAGITLIWFVLYGVNFTFDSVILLVLTYFLIVIAFIDMDHLIIPDKLTIPLIVGGLIFKAVQGEIGTAVIGALVGGGIFFLVFLVYPGGIGLGDIKLLTAVGIFLGWEKVIFILFLASIIGVIYMVPWMYIKKIGRKTPFAFGPYLVLATLIVIYGWNNIRIYFPGSFF